MSQPLCISTLDLEYFKHGGVATMALAFARIAVEEGFAPFFLTPSVVLHRTVRRSLKGVFPPPDARTEFHGYPCRQFGCHWPELEFNAHRFRRESLREVLHPSVPCFAVSGNNHAARPFLDLGLKYGLWAASTYWEDCRHGLFQSPWSLRKTLDLLAKPACERLERRIFSRATRVAMIARQAREDVLRINLRRSDDIAVIPVPVDVSTHSPSARPARRDILFIGRLSDPRKNLRLLLDAFSLCASRRPDMNLILIGSGNTEAVRMLERHAFQERIQWLQELSEDRKIERIRDALALVIPSFQEGYGIVGAEALACGVPVISTPCGGTADYVIHGETGFLLKGFDAVEMSNAILALASEPLLQQRLSRRAREFAQERLSMDVVRPLLQKFIRDLASAAG